MTLTLNHKKIEGFSDVAKIAIQVSKNTKMDVFFDWYGIIIRASEHSTVKELRKEYELEKDIEIESY